MNPVAWSVRERAAGNTSSSDRGPVGTVDYYAQIRSERAAERADVAILVCDALEGLTSEDLRIAEMAMKKGCATIIALNKWDVTRTDLEDATEKALQRLRLRPEVVAISAKTGRGIKRLMAKALDLADRARQRIPTSDLNRFVTDIQAAFTRGKQRYNEDPGLTCGGLYDYVCELAKEAGWEFGAASAGHLIGHFPHETAPGVPKPLSIRHGNPLPLRALDPKGNPRHWILEIHFVDRARQFGGFCEELLTIG